MSYRLCRLRFGQETFLRHPSATHPTPTTEDRQRPPNGALRIGGASSRSTPLNRAPTPTRRSRARGRYRLLLQIPPGARTLSSGWRRNPHGGQNYSLSRDPPPEGALPAVQCGSPNRKGGDFTHTAEGSTRLSYSISSCAFVGWETRSLKCRLSFEQAASCGRPVRALVGRRGRRHPSRAHSRHGPFRYRSLCRDCGQRFHHSCPHSL